MKKTIQQTVTRIAMLCLVLVLATAKMTAQINYLTAKPMSDVISTPLQPVNGFIKLPYITWGGDLQTILAKQEGLLSVTLFKEDDFQKQVQMCLKGETPAIRGTMGMINAAAELFQKQGTDLVVVVGLTTSEGGDCMVTRSGKSLNNISTVALQLYGPHMDYAANLFESSNRLGKVQFKWLQNLTIANKVDGKIVDPVSAFQKDNTLDAVMCISPDAALLTSGGVGSGTDNSVKGASVLVSTKTASKIIYDVYAFRKDFYTAHTEEVKSFVKAMFLAEEHLRDLRTNTKNPKYTALIAEGAKDFGLPAADVIGMLGDCRFLAYNGNVSFFTGKGTTRSFVALNKEIQTSFKTMGIMKSSYNLLQANWEYSTMASGLKNATAVAAPKFDEKKLAGVVEKTIAAESNAWEEKGTLFKVEIYFQPNQNVFSADQYAADFQKAIKIAQTYSGAVVVIEGHSDHGGVQKAKQKGTSAAEIKQMTQVAKNLSLERATNVKKSFLDYAKTKGLVMDASQLLPVGRGIESPKYVKPSTKEEWEENFRVVFLIKQMEAESDVFDPKAY